MEIVGNVLLVLIIITNISGYSKRNMKEENVTNSINVSWWALNTTYIRTGYKVILMKHCIWSIITIKLW